jgi:hypothetical protein
MQVSARNATILTGLISMALAATSASADVFIQVTRTGETATGLEDSAVIHEQGLYDVWMWSDVAGLRISAIEFRMGSPLDSAFLQWEVLNLGQVDPGNAFTPLIASDGDLEFGAIEAISIVQFPGFPGVLLGETPGQALRLYSGAEAMNLTAGGRLVAEVIALQASENFGNIHVIGITQTPAPSGLVALALGAGLVSRRRR